MVAEPPAPARAARRGSSAAAAWLTRLLRPTRPLPARGPSLADPGRVERVLVVKVHDQLGDFLLATPALRALREFYPRARLALVTREFLAPLARRNRDLDQVWALPRVRSPRDLAGLAATVGGIRRFRPDLAFVLNSVSRSKSGDALAALSGARLVVGRSAVFPGPVPADAPADPFEAARREERGGRDEAYDLDLGFARASDHQVDRYLDLVRWTGAAPSSLELRLDLEPEERRAGRAALLAADHPPAELGRKPAGGSTPEAVVWVGFHPGAANPLKCWPLESFVALGVSLAGSEPALRIAVFDSPRERGRAAAVCAGLEAHRVRAAFIPAGAIERFAAICAALDLLVCNDSGVTHIAAAVGVPTVSFHALGRLGEWGPRGPLGVALYAAPSIGSIPVSAALAAALGLLGRGAEAEGGAGGPAG